MSERSDSTPSKETLWTKSGAKTAKSSNTMTLELGLPSAYNYSSTGASTPDWLNKGDNAWQMTAATLVGMQSVPGLVILYGSYVKKKWAVNSAFMALYAFAATLIVWVVWAYRMSFGERLLPFWGKANIALHHKFLALTQAHLPASNLTNIKLLDKHESAGFEGMYYPMATMVYFQFVFAAITVILLAGALLGRMNIYAWILFVPLWVTFSYSVGAFSLWGGGFLFQMGVLDYSGGYVIHVSSGTAGLTAAYWVGPRLNRDREHFPPNNLLLMLAGAGILWLGWTGFNGGDPYAVNIDASMAVLNTHICAATSLLVWLFLDIIRFEKASVIGAVQGMITGLVCITPAAGLVEGWAAIIMGILSGSIPWYTMNILHKQSVLKDIDDTMACFHTHTVAGSLGGICVGLFAEPTLTEMFYPSPGYRGLCYSWKGNGGHLLGARQVGLQLVGIIFVVSWNVVATSLICFAIQAAKCPLRMSPEDMDKGDDAIHGEGAYALWGDGTVEIPFNLGMYGDHSEGASRKSGAVTPRTGALETGSPSKEPPQFNTR